MKLVQTPVPIVSGLNPAWWPHPLLTQTNGYSLSKPAWKGKHRKITPRLIINYLAQSVNVRDGSQRLR